MMMMISCRNSIRPTGSVVKFHEFFCLIYTSCQRASPSMGLLMWRLRPESCRMLSRIWFAVVRPTCPMACMFSLFLRSLRKHLLHVTDRPNTNKCVILSRFRKIVDPRIKFGNHFLVMVFVQSNVSLKERHKPVKTITYYRTLLFSALDKNISFGRRNHGEYILRREFDWSWTLFVILNIS